jgi:hypothetical protein
LTLVAGTGISIATTADQITFTNTVSDTNTTYSPGTLLDVSGTTFNVDLAEAGEAAIANGDYILFLDGGATGSHAKEAIADVASLFAGDGLTASASVMAVNVDDSTIETSSDAIRIKDNGVTLAKMAGLARGKIIVGDASGDPAALAAGDEDDVLTIDSNGDAVWEEPAGGGSGDVEAGSSFSTDGVIMAANGTSKTIDEPGATLTTNGQAMTVSSPTGTSFAVDGGNRDGNSAWTFTTGTGDSGSAQNNQASIKVTAQTSANANLYLGDTDVDGLERGGLRYKNNGDSLQIRANNQAVLECDSSKVVDFKIAGGAKTVTLENDAMDQYMMGSATVTVNATEWLQIKVNGNTRYIPVWS